MVVNQTVVESVRVAVQEVMTSQTPTPLEKAIPLLLSALVGAVIAGGIQLGIYFHKRRERHRKELYRPLHRELVQVKSTIRRFDNTVIPTHKWDEITKDLRIYQIRPRRLLNRLQKVYMDSLRTYIGRIRSLWEKTEDILTEYCTNQPKSRSNKRFRNRLAKVIVSHKPAEQNNLLNHFESNAEDLGIELPYGDLRKKVRKDLESTNLYEDTIELRNELQKDIQYLLGYLEIKNFGFVRYYTDQLINTLKQHFNKPI